MRKLAGALVSVALVFGLVGCAQADRVSHNISQDADNFKVMRRLAVINTVTDKPQLEIVGNFSIFADVEAS